MLRKCSRPARPYLFGALVSNVGSHTGRKIALWILFVIVHASGGLVIGQGDHRAPIKVIIDADPGIDDAIAILTALQSPELDVLGITTVFGNATLDAGTQNALRIVELGGWNVPVARGAENPLIIPAGDPPDFVHGSDGLGNTNMPPPKGKHIGQSAAEFIVETVRSDSGSVTIVSLGRLTNLALALELDPDLPKYVKEVILMGGAATVAGNVTPVAEANIWGDPHAADIVFTAGWPVTMVGLDVTTQVRLSNDILLRIKQRNPTIGTFIHDISQFYLAFYESLGVSGGMFVHDPSAVAFAIDPTIFDVEPLAVRVAIEGIAIGQTIAASELHSNRPGPWHDIPATGVALGVDAEGLLGLLEETLSRKREPEERPHQP